MALARVKYTADRVFNQMDPELAIELLPVWEAKLGLVPSFTSTIQDREVAAENRYNVQRTGTRAAIETALTVALGDDFIVYRTTSAAERVTYPSSPGATTGPANWLLPNAPIRLYRLTSCVTRIGTAVSVAYEPVDSSVDSTPIVGDPVVVSTNNWGLAERVVVTVASSTAFTATFTKSHDIGDICTTGPFPFWLTNQLHALIVVTQAAAESAATRRAVDAIMRQMGRGVVTWDIVPAADSTHVAAFKTDDPVLGRTGYAPLGPSVTY
jgi:uncharacterized protein YmfQ (DUF2313 family)